MICEKCGYGGTQIDNTPGIVTCQPRLFFCDSQKAKQDELF